MSRAVQLLVLAALCGSAVLVQAQDRVYRCGAAYSNEPCANARNIDVADTRSAEQAAQAQQAALRDAREADTLERQRLQIERLAASRGPVLMGPSSKSVGLDDGRCANGTTCKRGAAKKRHHGEVPPVTLYRAVGAH